MMRESRRQTLQFSCPSGGNFYSCDSGSSFVGCCTVDPCSKGCNEGNLKPASFDVDDYSKLTDQQCSTGSRWYVCTDTQPPFLGCCKSNPCQNEGCPVGDLTAGFLDSNPKFAAPFVSTAGTSISQLPLTANPTISPTTGTLVIQPTTSGAGIKPNQASPGTIAGIIVGSMVIFIFLVTAAVLLIWRRKSAKMLSKSTSQNSEFYEKDGIDVHEASFLRSDGWNDNDRGGGLELRPKIFMIVS